MVELMLALTFISSVLMSYQALRYVGNKQKVILRIKKYINIKEIKGEKKKSSRKELKAGLSVFAKGIKSLKFLDGYKKRVQSRLNRAHILLKAEEFITIRIIMFIVGGLLMYLVTSSALFMLGGCIIGWLIPGRVLEMLVRKRIKTLNEQLGDAITLISNSLKSGYSFFQSIDIVGKEMAGPISEEFGLLQKEISLGAATEKALENMVQRVGSEDLELVVTAVLIQRQTGGNLSLVLENISSTIRDRVKIKREVKTITAQGRMSGMIISLLPLFLGLIIYLINPEHIEILFTTSLGLGILVFSVVMELLGIYLINKIVRIEL